MTPLDPDILKALATEAPPAIDAARLDQLASRIDAAAGPLLYARRARPAGLLDIPARWAMTLVSAGVVVAIASALMLSRTPASALTRQPSVAPVVVLGAASAAGPRTDLIELAVNDLVSPPPRQRIRRR